MFCIGEVIEKSMASDFPKDQLFIEISSGLQTIPGVKLSLSKYDYKSAKFIIWYRVFHT